MRNLFFSRALRMVGVLSLAVGLLVPAVGSAATTAASSNTPSGQGLSISPPLVSSSANPGQSTVIKFQVRNITNEPLIVTSTADDFGASGENGDPKIFLNETTSTRYSLKFWVAPIANPIIQPQTTMTIPVTINVPANAEPGGHYGVIRFTGKPPTASPDSVALSASLGALVLFTVNGNIVHHLSVVDILTSQKGKNSRFFQQGPINLSVRIRNDGDVHESPTGSLTISNLFGGKVTNLVVNQHGGNILPGSIRAFPQKLAKKGLFGRYTIKGALTYDGNKVVVLPATSFWVIPIKLVLIIVLILVVLFLLLRFGLRRYKRHIIEQARKR